jgi:hypothetical protein
MGTAGLGIGDGIYASSRISKESTKNLAAATAMMKTRALFKVVLAIARPDPLGGQLLGHLFWLRL